MLHSGYNQGNTTKCTFPFIFCFYNVTMKSSTALNIFNISLYHLIIIKSFKSYLYLQLIYFLSQVKSQSAVIDDMLKSSVCQKTNVAHMTKTVYDPSCLQYCGDLCGVRCRNQCNKDHNACKRGKLSGEFLNCPSAVMGINDLSLGFITYETNEVDTFGKGASFTRVEKVSKDYSYGEFMGLLQDEFYRYAEHTLSYWFLRATKIEAFAPSKARSATVTITSDFGEAIQIVAKREVSDQFYHRPEVDRPHHRISFFVHFQLIIDLPVRVSG